MKKLKMFALLICLMSKVVAQEHTRKVLFIGNSYTAVNNLPQLIKDIALPLGDTLVFDQSLFGGYFFQDHCNNAVTWSKIKSQQWDAVVLQAQSQEPSWDLWQVMQDTYPYAQQLADSVKAHNVCTEVIFYMTWGRQNGDAFNCASIPAVCTYTGMQARLRESYMLFKNDFKTAVAPVGVAWKKVRQDFPGINLYDPDQSHPSVAGSYLAACVFYSNIFKKTSVGSTHLAGLTNSVVNSLQSYGSNTVLDSLDVWGVGSNKPKVDFTFTPTGSNTYQFTNQTLYANSYNWSFGSTLQNPIYTFTNTGTFSVTLAATNSCTTISKTKQVVIAGVNEQSNKLNFKSFYANDYLYLYNLPKSDVLNLKLISVDGKESFNNTINSSKDDYAVYLGNIPKGIYLIRLSANQYYGVNKLIIN